MIKHFKSKVTWRLFNREQVPTLSLSVQRSGLRKLMMLNAARDLIDLRSPPANCLEKLQGDYLGKHSIRINLQWRVVFRWEDGNAYEVEIVDYH